jgi:RHS repeat-associated protein
MWCKIQTTFEGVRFSRMRVSSELISLPILICLSLFLPCDAAKAVNNGMQYQIPASEYSALVDLYNSAGGHGWTIYTNGWLNGQATSWDGVTVTGVIYDKNGNVLRTGNVYYLELPENNLMGSILASLGNLSQLQYLDLSDNQLTGSIPASLGNLTVQVFYLYHNQFTGSIPASFGNLSQCVDLELQNNQLTGSIPASLGNLRVDSLYLYDNQLTGSIPDTLTNIAPLGDEILDLELQDNQLTGEVPNLTIRFQPIFGEKIYLYDNCLDVSHGSQSLTNIGLMTAAGIIVYYEPQNTGCPTNIPPSVSEAYKDVGCLSCQMAVADPSVGNPIRLGNGNKFEEVADYSTAGANPLSFTRYYNSLGDTNTAAVMLGVNWRSTYDRYLRISGSIAAERADGQELIFTSNGTNWTSDSDVDVQLVQAGSTWILVDSDDSVETYNSGGLLASVQARDGYLQTLQYNGGNQLESVTDSFGRSLQFAYQGSLLQTVMTPDGLVLTYGYNSSGVNPGVVDRLASVTYSTTPQTSQAYLYTNTSVPFAMTGIIDENGNLFACWTYDSTGRAISSQHANGTDLTTIGYNDTDGSRTVSNALGSVMVYKFTVLQGVPKVTEIDRLATASVPAAIMTQTYDGNGYLAGNTDWNTNLTTVSNDYRGLPLTNNEAVGTVLVRTTTNVWHQTFHVPLQTAGPRKITAFTYDTNGNMLTRTETDTSTGTVPYSTSGQTRTWSNTYDNLGHVLTATGPRTDVIATTTFTYDGSNNISTITDALGHVSHITNYNGSGLPLTMIDPNYVTTTFAYDARDRLLTRTVQAASGNATTTFGYDAAGQLTSIILPDGSRLNYQYDAAHRLVSVSNTLGESIAYTLDAAANITQQNTRNAGTAIVKTQSGVFDQLSRMLQQIGAYSETTTYGYDSDGNRILVNDGLTNTTTRAFDALNRLVASIDPLHNDTGYGYDPQDNLTSVTDPRLLVTSYVYDGFRRVIQESSPDKGTTVYTLDLAGNRVSQADARGVVTLRTFDKLNRVTAETFPASPGENIAYSYDATSGGNKGIGRFTGYTDETGSTRLTYNERGDVISTTRVIGGHSYTTAYGYDLADHVISITYPSGDVIAYTRDTQGRISSVSYLSGGSGTPVSLAANVTYMPFGPVSGLVYGNGLARKQNYDQDYRLTGITTSASGVNVQNLSLGYDAVNDIRSITDNLDGTRSQAFAYDPDYRLTQGSGIYGTLGYTYDPAGNRLTQTTGIVTESYNYASTANMLQSTVKSGVTRTLAYTLNGNLSSDNRGTATNLLFNYGNRNRYNALYSGASTVASYNYNALGERLIKTVGSTTTHYHYDQKGHLIAESQSSGAVIKEYVWLDDMPLAQIESNGIVHYIHPDHLNTPQKLTDAMQDIVWDRDQQPFGATQSITFPALSPALTSLTYNAQHQFQFTVTGSTNYAYTLQASTNLSSSNWVPLIEAEGPFTFTDLETTHFRERFYRAYTTASVVTENLRFPGQYFDAESGLNYNMMRDYDPTLGRYIQNDPLGLTGGLNPYGYAGASSLNASDPWGLRTIFAGGAGLNGGYIQSMVAAMERAGIQNVTALNPNDSMGTILDILSIVPLRHLLSDSDYARIGPVNFKNNACEQLNFVGYSFGSVLAAQEAMALAKTDHYVDNVVLIGSPVGGDLLQALQTSPQIGNVIVINLTQQGDPIYAGMSDLNLLKSLPILNSQFSSGGAGHFYYAPSTQEGAARRADLAKTLSLMGLK